MSPLGVEGVNGGRHGQLSGLSFIQEERDREGQACKAQETPCFCGRLLADLFHSWALRSAADAVRHPWVMLGPVSTLLFEGCGRAQWCFFLDIAVDCG